MPSKLPGVTRYGANRDEEFDFLLERFDAVTATWSAWDLSGETLSVRARAWVRPAGSKAASAYELDVELSKVSGGSGGRVRGFGRFVTARPSIECEVVVVDAAVTNAATPSGKRETRVRWWDGAVESTLGA